MVTLAVVAYFGWMFALLLGLLAWSCKAEQREAQKDANFFRNELELERENFRDYVRKNPPNSKKSEVATCSNCKHYNPKSSTHGRCSVFSSLRKGTGHIVYHNHYCACHPKLQLKNSGHYPKPQ